MLTSIFFEKAQDAPTARGLLQAISPKLSIMELVNGIKVQRLCSNLTYEQYADLLATVAFVNAQIDEYTTTFSVVCNQHSGARSLSCG